MFLSLLASVPNPFDFADIFRNIKSRWYVYVVVAVIIALLLSLVFINKKERNKLTSTQKIVYTAVLSALCFLANLLTVKINDLWQVSLVATFGFISGYLLGSGLGFVCSFLGDFICAIVAPTGVFSPVLCLGTGLMGFIPGLIFERFKVNDYLKLIISYISVFILSSIFVNTLGLVLLYGFPIETYIVRIPTSLLTIVVNCVISITFIPLFPRILPKGKFFIEENLVDKEESE